MPASGGTISLSSPEGRSLAEPRPAPVLSCRGLRKTFDGPTPVHALQDATFDIYQAEFVAIVGRSGSGKSTLLNLLGLLDTPTSGELVLGGTSTIDLDPRARARFRARQLGFVFQAFHLLPDLSAVDNVTVALSYQGIPRRQRGALAVTALRRMGLGHRLHAKARTLSGGEQQRVALARALAHEPSLILADEPTGNLDSRTEQEIAAALRALVAEGRTVVVVTHNLDLASAADRCLSVRDGVVTGSST